MRGHGWYALEPSSWDADQGEFAFATESGQALRVRATLNEWVVRFSGGERAAARRAVTRVFGLDRDLGGFWDLCRERDPYAWVAERRAGHLLRSPTLFEDLLKILCTTNCTWAATENMVRKICSVFGVPTDLGRPAFPTAEALAPLGESDWREQLRFGYRAKAGSHLARAFAEGDLDAEWFENPETPTEELRRTLASLPGFGPYAVGQALRLLDRFEDLAIDSWCRAKAKELHGLRKAPSDAWFVERTKPFGHYAGLALWMELTRDWHESEMC